MDIKDQNRKIYQKPEMELCYLELSDVIVCSGTDDGITDGNCDTEIDIG